MKTIYFFRQKGSAYAFIGTTRNLERAFSGFDQHNPWGCYTAGTIVHIAADEIHETIRKELVKRAHYKPGFYMITDTEIETICNRYSKTTADWIPILSRVIAEHKGERLSNIQIQELLEREGVQANHIQVGRALMSLGLKKRQARINGRVKLAYQL